MGNTIDEMKTNFSIGGRRIPPDGSRALSIPAIEFAAELNCLSHNYFNWPKFVWPTVDGKKFIIPVPHFGFIDVVAITTTLVQAKRFDLLEKIHFTVHISPTGYWVPISPTELDDNDRRIHSPTKTAFVRALILHLLSSLMHHNVLIEYLDRYSTRYLKQLVKEELNFFIDETKDNLEFRIHLMRYIQDDPKEKPESDLYI